MVFFLLIKYLRKPYIFFTKGRGYVFLIKTIPLFRRVYLTRNNESPIVFKQWFNYLLNRDFKPYWSIHPTSKFVGSWKNVYVGIDSDPGISPGCYINALGKIYVDDYAQIAPNVGILSANHFMLDIRLHINSEVRIGKYSRIGMGSIIHPGVILGDFTTVAAGSIVTKSFPTGYCVIAGNPAEIVEDFSKNDNIKNKFLRYKNENEFNGFIPNDQFESFRIKYLNI